MGLVTEITRTSLRRLFTKYDGEFTVADYLLETSRTPGVDWWGDLEVIEFLDRLYDLDALPSSDQRYRTAREDIGQHFISNCDWDIDWILTDERFIHDDDTLLRFLAETLHPAVRHDKSSVARLKDEYNKLLRRDGYEIMQVDIVSGAPVFGYGPVIPIQVTAKMLRDEIGQAIRHGYRAGEVENLCDKLNMPPLPASSTARPMDSKAAYVVERINTLEHPELVDLARNVLNATTHEPHEPLADLIVEVDRTLSRAVRGTPKNLIFAAIGHKPELVLVDAVNNDIQITAHADQCLVYDREINPNRGLSWQMLVDWWASAKRLDGDRETALQLHRRLLEGLNDAEQYILNTYARLYKERGFSTPALVPQVYIHYDPYTHKQHWQQHQSAGPLPRQRMDFLLLLPNRRRIIIELDGKHHYAADDGVADPNRYARMVAEDRRLRLLGYEVYRFGGVELVNKKRADQLLNEFFFALLA